MTKVVSRVSEGSDRGKAQFNMQETEHIKIKHTVSKTPSYPSLLSTTKSRNPKPIINKESYFSSKSLTHTQKPSHSNNCHRQPLETPS